MGAYEGTKEKVHLGLSPGSRLRLGNREEGSGECWSLWLGPGFQKEAIYANGLRREW